MSVSFLSPLLKSAAALFSRVNEPVAVRVDRDVLRTTLIQCEHELREMHRLLKASPELGRHRTRQPSCRY